MRRLRPGATGADMTQLALPLSAPDDGLGQERGSALICTACNQHVLQRIAQWRQWPFQSAVLTGETKSGKSAIGAAFVLESGGDFVDDADEIDDETLFHRWNEAQAKTRPVLFAASKPIKDWGIDLPDLMSRLNASEALTLGPPDDEMCERLLQQQLARLGNIVGDVIAEFAATRMERSYAAIIAAAHTLHKVSMQQKRAIGQKMIRETLQNLSGAHDESE